jgi:hypothetical protein
MNLIQACCSFGTSGIAFTAPFVFPVDVAIDTPCFSERRAYSIYQRWPRWQEGQISHFGAPAASGRLFLFSFPAQAAVRPGARF